MSYCTNCGSKNPDDAKFCESCGTPLAEATQPAQGAQPTEPYASPATAQATQPMPGAPGAPTPPATPKSSGKAIAALVFGILAIVFSFTILIGIICGVVAIILGVSEWKQTPDGKAKVGRILGIIGTILSVLSLVFYLMFGAFIGLLASNGSVISDEEAEEIAKALVEGSTSGTQSKSSSAAKSSSSSSSSSAAATAPAPAPTPAQHSIVGTWQGTLQSGEICIYDLFDNGSYLQYIDGEIFDSGLYSTLGNELYLDGDYQSEIWTFEFKDSGNSLLLSWPGYDATFIFYRIT